MVILMAEAEPTASGWKTAENTEGGEGVKLPVSDMQGMVIRLFFLSSQSWDVRYGTLE